MAHVKKTLKRLRAVNGRKRAGKATLACFQYQKDLLVRRAIRRGMTVSYYLNTLLWKDWVD